MTILYWVMMSTIWLLLVIGVTSVWLLCMRSITWPVYQELTLPTFLKSLTPSCLSLCNLYGAMMKFIWTFQQKQCFAHVKGQKVHCACSVSRDTSVAGQKQPHIWNPDSYLPIHCSTFMGLWWRLGGSLLGKILLWAIFVEKFSKSENGPNFRVLGGLGFMGLKKLWFLLQKVPSLHESTSSKPFWVKIG